MWTPAKFYKIQFYKIQYELTNTVEIPLASHSGHHHPELGVSHPKLFFLFLLHVCVNLIEYFVFLILNCITLFLLHAKILSFIHVDLCSSSSFIFCCCVIFHCMDMPQSHSPTDICLDISLFFFMLEELLLWTFSGKASWGLNFILEKERWKLCL